MQYCNGLMTAALTVCSLSIHLRSFSAHVINNAAAADDDDELMMMLFLCSWKY